MPDKLTVSATIPEGAVRDANGLGTVADLVGRDEKFVLPDLQHAICAVSAAGGAS